MEGQEERGGEKEEKTSVMVERERRVESSNELANELVNEHLVN